MNVRHLIVTALLCLISQRVGATAQMPEVLIHGGKTYDLSTLPLTPFLAKHPKKLPQAEGWSTGLWRGYVGTWALRDGFLFVQDVRVPTKAFLEDVPESKQYRSVMRDLFGASTPQKATWFTGHLIVPTGDIVEYVHMGFASTHSSYLVATIVEGVVLDCREMTLSEFQVFQRRQFEQFKKTTQFADAVKEARSGGEKMTDEQIENFIFQFYAGDFESRVFEPLTAPH